MILKNTFLHIYFPPLFYHYFSITIYPPYTLFHIHPLPSLPPHPSPAVTILLSMSMSSLFQLNPFTTTPTLLLPDLSACSLSMSLPLFCLLVQFAHQIPPMSENIWYLSFSVWLISLCKMLSRSIHALSKDNISSFLGPNSIPLCKCATTVLPTHLIHLLMDT